MRHGLATLFLMLTLAGCSVLPKPAAEGVDRYMLEYVPQPAAERAIAGDLPVMLVAIPRAHGGYDSNRIAYMQETHGLRYFTRSRWVDAPAHMLAALMADALQATGRFQALYAGPGAVAADLRLDTELVQFHQDFRQQPSEVRVVIRARLVDLDSNRVIASREFAASQAAPTDDAYGGVVAANSAIATLLAQLSQFCLDNRP
jgi:cholesterol transport system auxiliary component